MRAGSVHASILVAALALAPSGVRAGNDDEVFLGNQAVLSGGAVTATVSDGAALVYEPSGLVEGEDDTIDVSVTALGLRVHHADRVLAMPDGGGRDARYTEFVSIPTTLAYTRTLSPRIRAGFGLFATRGSTLRIRETLDVPGVNEVSAYQITVVQRSSTLYAAAGLGYRVNDALRLGFALGFVYDSDDATLLLGAQRAVTAGDTAVTTDFTALDTLLSYARFGLRATFGARYVPNERFRLAVSITTPGLAVAGSTSESITATAYSSRPIVPVAGNEVVANDSFRFGAGMLSPLRARAGILARFGRTSVSFDADLQTRARDATYGVDRRFLWNVRAGARLALSETLALGGGLFTDRSGVPAVNDAVGSSETRDFYGMTFGLETVKVRRLAEGEDATALRFVSTYAIRYSVGVGDGSGLVAQPSFDATALGTLTTIPVRTVTHELSLYIGSSLRF